MDEKTPREPLPESRFFAADDRCPHPERWTSTDEDSTEVEVSALLAGLTFALQPDLVVETGAAFGQTTAAIAAALTQIGHGDVVGLEPDAVRAAYARGRLTGAGYERWMIVESESLKWEPPPFVKIDLLYLDGLYYQRIDEFRHFRRWMRVGSLVAFHDTAPARDPDVRLASGRDLPGEIEAELVEPGWVRAISLPTPRGITLAEVIL